MPARNVAKAKSFGSTDSRGEREPELVQEHADIHHLGTSNRAGQQFGCRLLRAKLPARGGIFRISQRRFVPSIAHSERDVPQRHTCLVL